MPPNPPSINTPSNSTTTILPSNSLLPPFIQFNASEDSEIPQPDYNNRVPNIREIIDTLAYNVSSGKRDMLVKDIEMLVQLVDWKQKGSVRSQIKRACKRMLQEEMSVVDSNQLAERILKNLLAPEENMSAESNNC